MSIVVDIEKVEQKWLKLILPYIKNIFKDKWIPSHDQSHALRTWNFAKEIILTLNKYASPVSPLVIEKIFIAIFFHDTGMSECLDIKHGKISRIICESFFNSNKTMKPDEIEDILEAIEFHDDKSYKNEVFKKSHDKTGVISILSIADDLDSFGIFGIFRFWEINVLRGHSIENIPVKVLASLETRLQYFTSMYSSFPEFYDRHKTRHQLTRDFYLSLQHDIKTEQSNGNQQYAQMVVKLFDTLIIQEMISPDKILSHVKSANINPKVLSFFNNFVQEYNHNESLNVLSKTQNSIA